MQENKWLLMKKVCVYLHISRDTVMNWIKKKVSLLVKRGACGDLTLMKLMSG